MDTIPAWLPDEFDELNKVHFGGRLPPLTIQAFEYQGKYANYVSTAHLLWIHPRTLDQERKYIADTLLHEMLHYALDLRSGGDSDPDHGESFVNLANEIGATLGLPRVEPASVEAAEWPQSVRPVGYHSPWR